MVPVPASSSPMRVDRFLLCVRISSPLPPFNASSSRKNDNENEPFSRLVYSCPLPQNLAKVIVKIPVSRLFYRVST